MLIYKSKVGDVKKDGRISLTVEKNAMSFGGYISTHREQKRIRIRRNLFMCDQKITLSHAPFHFINP